MDTKGALLRIYVNRPVSGRAVYIMRLAANMIYTKRYSSVTMRKEYGSKARFYRAPYH
jgi:hypothetical protein